MEFVSVMVRDSLHSLVLVWDIFLLDEDTVIVSVSVQVVVSATVSVHVFGSVIVLTVSESEFFFVPVSEMESLQLSDGDVVFVKVSVKVMVALNDLSFPLNVPVTVSENVTVRLIVLRRVSEGNVRVLEKDIVCVRDNGTVYVKVWVGEGGGFNVPVSVRE